MQPRPDADPGGRTHVPALDGIRGIAVLLVLVLHFTLYGAWEPGGYAGRLAYKVLTAGWIGVDLFFVLSGFLITGILFDAKGGNRYFRNFYARRVLRIFPLYYGTLVVFCLLLPAMFPAHAGFQTLRAQGIWYWTYLANVLVARDGWSAFGPIDHFWTLAVEEQFYLVWPLLVWRLDRRKLMGVCVAAIGGSLLVRIALELRGHEVAAHVLTPARLDALAAGALLALVARGPAGLHRVRRVATGAAGASAVALMVIFAWRRGLPSEDPVVSTVGYSLLAAVFGGFLAAGVTAPPASVPARVLTSPILRMFGRYSYALYVFHHPFLALVRPHLAVLDPVPTLFGSRLPAQLLFMAVGTALLVGVAALSWELYEKQFLRLKRRFPYAPSHPHDAGGAVLERLDRTRSREAAPGGSRSP